MIVAFDPNITFEEGKVLSSENSRYFNLGNGVIVRLSGHYGNADTFARNGEMSDNYGIVIKQTDQRFKEKQGVDYLEYVYFNDLTDAERQKAIVAGIRKFIETYDFQNLPEPDKINPSGRFKNPDGEHKVAFSISPEEDAAYMSAVENGDMETAGRMVREAARRAMTDTKVVDENGEPLVVYHGGMFGQLTKQMLNSGLYTNMDVKKVNAFTPS